jgi:hypothetical protein
LTSRIAFADFVAIKRGVAPSLLFEQVLTVMATGEGNNVSSFAQFNPIDTEWYLPGATPYNSVNVWNYPNLATGVLATALTFNGWPLFRDAIAQPNATVASVIVAVNESDGDQSAYYSQFVDPVLARWPHIGEILVAGSSMFPAPPERELPMVVQLTGTKGPLWLVQAGGAAPAPLLIRRTLSVAEEAQLCGPGGLGFPILNWTQAQLAGIPVVP